MQKLTKKQRTIENEMYASPHTHADYIAQTRNASNELDKTWQKPRHFAKTLKKYEANAPKESYGKKERKILGEHLSYEYEQYNT